MSKDKEIAQVTAALLRENLEKYGDYPKALVAAGAILHVMPKHKLWNVVKTESGRTGVITEFDVNDGRRSWTYGVTYLDGDPDAGDHATINGRGWGHDERHIKEVISDEVDRVTLVTLILTKEIK